MVDPAEDRANSLGENLSSTSKAVVLACVVLVMVGGCFLAYECRVAIPQIAANGWGPHHYVAFKTHPELFTFDWHNNIDLYDASLIMRLYHWITHWLNISVTKTMYFFIFLELVALAASVCVLSQTLFNNITVTVMTLTGALCSPAFGINLGNFGNGLGHHITGLYYGGAHALCFLAFASVLQRRYLLALTSLGLAANVHMALAVQASLFTLPFLLTQKGILKEQRLWLGACLGGVMSLPAALFVLSSASGGLGPSRQEWLDMTRVFGFHWYPISLELFSSAVHVIVLPLVLITFCSLQATRFRAEGDPGARFLLMGMFASTAMTTVGVICSEVVPIPFVIRFCPQRSSIFLTVIECLWVVHYLYQKMSSGRVLGAIVAGFAYLTLMFAMPGIALLPFVVLLAEDLICDQRLGGVRLKGRFLQICRAAAAALCCLAVVPLFRKCLPRSISLVEDVFMWPLHLGKPLAFLDPTQDWNLCLRGGCIRQNLNQAWILVLSVILVMALRLHIGLPRLRKSAFAGVVAMLSATLVWTRHADAEAWLAEHGNSGAYLDLQCWCRDHTPSDAVFLRNPTRCYGWRDFSERGSFGVVHEWAYCAFCYKSGKHSWSQSLERFAMFGIDLPVFLRNALSEGKSSSAIRGEIDTIVAEKFQRMDMSFLRDLRRRHNVSYVIVDHRSAVPTGLDRCEQIYGNDAYVLFKIPSD